jgi:hypothetical protein
VPNVAKSPEEVELFLKGLDGKLESGQISLAGYLRGLHQLIGQVLEAGEDETITALAVLLQPTKPWEHGR